MNEVSQSFVSELRKRINIAYELAIALDREVVDREERYFGVNCSAEEVEEIPDTISGEMFALLQRTMAMIERAHKYVLEV